MLDGYQALSWGDEEELVAKSVATLGRALEKASTYLLLLDDHITPSTGRGGAI